MSNPLEQIYRLQEQIDKLYSSQLINQIENFSNIFPAIQQVQQHAHLISILEKPSLFLASINPLIESIKHQQEYLQRIGFDETLTQKITEWSSIIEKINFPAILSTAIPEDIYLPLNEVTHELKAQNKSSSDLSCSVTVSPKEQCEKKNYNWLQLVMFLIAVLTYFTNYFNHIEQVKFETELMNELKHQTALEEKIISFEDNQSKINQEQTIAIKELENKFDILMKTIKPLIPENSNVSESDQ